MKIRLWKAAVIKPLRWIVRHGLNDVFDPQRHDGSPESEEHKAKSVHSFLKIGPQILAVGYGFDELVDHEEMNSDQEQNLRNVG